MRLYEATIKEFSNDVIHNRIADLLSKRFEDYYKKKANESEYRAWRQSLNILNNSFTHSGLSENRLIIEYELPYTSRRIDVILFGKGLHDQDNVVLIELKQWSNEHLKDCPTEGNILVDYGRFKKEQAHPCLQVQGYHFDLKDFLVVFQEKKVISLDSCAYCHNYSKNADNVLFFPKFNRIIKQFPLFAKEDLIDLGNYLKERLSHGAGQLLYERFISSPIRPSKRLLEHSSDMINKQQIFNLIDDQTTAYNAIMHKAKILSKTKLKSAIVVKGGPGTGKSVIALEVMGEMMRQGKVVYHATGSSAFTKTLRKVVGRRASNLFKFFFSFTKYKENEIDILICDEAHRIRVDSNDYGVPWNLRSKNPQVEDLIKPAKLTIFFIDEYQIVRPKEIGSIALIKNAARKCGIQDSEMLEFELKTQFRCSGSDSYLQWLDDALGIRETEFNIFDNKMEFKVFDEPLSLKKAIDERNKEKHNSARIVAGFCWPWSEPKQDGSLVKDVKIGKFEMPWEKKNEFWKWATDTSGMEQVGTVYTSQGFEFDYIGVIFGNDLVYDVKRQEWIAVPENSHDSMVKRNNKELLRHLKSVYRVLMSRAHKGVYIYFMDETTKKYFISRLTSEFEVKKQKPEEVLYVDEFLKDLIPYNDLEDAKKFDGHIPVFSLQAVASGFGETQIVEGLGWKKLDFHVRDGKSYFIARIKGRSMEPTISDGSYCLFRWERGGSRNGLIVLVASDLFSDPESEQRFTIKRYTSEKEFFEDGTWRHKKITLSPDNKNFKNIVLEDVQPGEFRILAEFVKVIS
ncbi:MAG: DUF2075 domain-containing protein [Candidatus Omnitrophica bacterium]|nr:DUF2075 domain-containing protein [Candidatus Omnitrophota bacterium]